MKKFSGFTLAEVMISLTIIGVIMVFYVPVHKIVSTQYTTLAYAALENLSQAAKELLSGDVYVKIDGEKKLAAVEVDRKLILNPETPAFCSCFAEIMNISGLPNCPTSESGYVSVKNIGSYALTLKFETFDWNSPNLIGTNGQRYYISAHQDPDPDYISNYGFRLIAVDLTGKKKPNSRDQYPDQPGHPDDIVYFVMTDNGAVYPTGVAATNRNYINTRTIAYYYSITNVPDAIVESQAKGCKTFTSGEGIDDFKSFLFNADRFKVQSSDSDAVKKQKEHILNAGCNFWKDNLLSGDTENHPDEGTYSYQMAYCLKNGQTADFKGYNCQGIFSQNAACDMTSATHADECVIEAVKPLYKVKI